MKILVKMVGFQVVGNFDSVFHLHQFLVETGNLPNQVPEH